MNGRLKAWLAFALIASSAAGILCAQSDTNTARTDYRNQLYDPAPTVPPGTSLTQPLSIAFYSGSIGAGTNVLATSTNLVRPNDGQNYLVQSSIGQPVGMAVASFFPGVQGSGTVTASPVEDFYQLGQTVSLTAQAGRYYAFAGWLDGVTSAQRTVVVGLANNYVARFTNTVALETNAVAGVTRVAPVGTPWIIIGGQVYSNNVVPATNGTQFSVQLQTSYPNGVIRYTTDGSDPNGSTNLYGSPFSVTAPFSIQAVAFQQDFTDPQPADPVDTLSATTPGGGMVSVFPQTDFYTGAASAMLTANPSPGWNFMSWTGDSSDTSAVSTLAMNGPKSVQGIFGTAVAPTVNGSGYVTSIPSQTLYPYGSIVRLAAVPAPGNFFSLWGGALQGGVSPVEFTVTNAGPNIQATFAGLSVNHYALTLLTFGGGDVTPDPAAQQYASGSPVALTATPRVGQSFVGWSGDASGTNNPLTVVMTNSKVIIANFAVTQPLFAIGAPAYSVNETNDSVAISVVNQGVLGTNVSFATVDGSAIGGSGTTGDYTATNGVLSFTNGPSAQTICVRIRDQFLVGPDKTFQVVLSNPGAGGSLGSPSTTTVTIHYNEALNTNGSLLVQAFPGPVPDHSGSLQVTLLPPGIGGQWRFAWELGWRNSGSLVTNLEQGNYPLAFRQLPGYVIPALPPQAVFTNAPTTEVTNQYAGSGGGLGWLKVNLGPNVVTNGGWRLLGESVWRAGGSTATGLAAGTRLVEFKPVSGLSAPVTRELEVFANQGSLISAYYLIATTTPANVALPAPVPDATAISAGLTNTPRLPYAFNGQLQSDVGYGSGVAVRDNVVLTAAHLVFNDAALSYVSQVSWFFQKHSGRMDPNPMPLTARGWYLSSSYAAQRIYDLTNGYSPGVSSPQSRNWDVAALYFQSPAARGGYGGYLASDAPTNQWLSSPLLKMLVGYPVDGASFGYTNLVPGEMHSIPPTNYAFTLQNDQVYASPDFLSFPGNSGGPVYVLYTNSVYYPAAVYLGTLNGDSVVRGIDSNVVNLITLAATLGDAGANQTGGGVITITAGSGSGSLAYLQVNIGPQEALDAGAKWRVQGTTNWSAGPTYTEAIASGGSVTLEFYSIPGWNLPTNNAVQIALGQVTEVSATYTPNPAQMAVAPAGGLVSSGYAGGPFSPPLINYTVTNAGGADLNWSVSKTADWLTLSASSGTLAAGVSTNVTVNVNANSLAPGSYSDTVGFTNLNNSLGNTAHPVSLLVSNHPPVQLTGVSLLTNGALAMTLEGVAGRVYAIVTSTNLLDSLANWAEILRLTNTTGQTTFTNPPPVLSPQYYRAKEL